MRCETFALFTSFAFFVYADENYIVVEGDTLWQIAKIFYSDPLRWEEVYKANLEKIKDPNIIHPQQVLVLPGLSKAKPEPTQAVPLPSRMSQPPIEVVQPAAQSPKTPETPTSPKPVEIVQTTPVAETIADYDGKIIAGQEKKNLYAQGDRMMVNVGLRHGLVDGDTLYVVRRTQRIRDDHSKKMIWRFQEIGRLKVLVAHETDAEVEIMMSHDPVAIGDGVIKKK